MKITYKMSPEKRAKARKILLLRREGFTYPQIQKLFNHHRAYLNALRNEAERLEKEEGGELGE